MSAILEEGHLKSTIYGSKDKEPVFEFYGGMRYKQNENRSLYHYGNTSGITAVDGDDQQDHWEQLRLVRNKCINLYNKYTSKAQ